MRLHTLEALALALSRRGQYGAGLDAALAAVHAEPLRESAHRIVARLHLREGNRIEALRQFERYQRLLFDELGVDASPEFAAMVAFRPRVRTDARNP